MADRGTAIVLRAPYAMSGTATALCAISGYVLRDCYETSGTDIGPCATRALCHVRDYDRAMSYAFCELTMDVYCLCATPYLVLA
eukprot:1589323-Rhodomonas_salina.1